MTTTTAGASLRSTLDRLPDRPGVYMMKGRQGTAIYVGKAKNLRQRVRAYFQPGQRDGRRQFRALLRSVRSIDFIMTASEQEALLLEAIQIRALRPRYNVSLKENREYPYIRLTRQHYPRLLATHAFVDDGSRYFGPFSDIRAMYQTLELVVRQFGLRTCRHRLPAANRVPCLEYHLHRCSAPCSGGLSETDYDLAVQRAISLIEGRDSAYLECLRASMAAAAVSRNYEQAARLRDQLRALEFMRNRQKVWLDEPLNRDVVGCARHGCRAGCCLLVFRDGHLRASRHQILTGCPADTDTHIVLDFLRRQYGPVDPEYPFPDEIQTTAAQPGLPELRRLAGPNRPAPVWIAPEAHPVIQDLAARNARYLLEIKPPDRP